MNYLRMHRARVFTSGGCRLRGLRLAPDTDLRQRLSRDEVPIGIGAKLLNAVLAAKEVCLSLEFESSSRGVLVNGHAANGINRVSGAKMSMMVIHFSVD